MFQRILVVCTGNICRSPVAAAMFRARLPGRKVSSAGLGALVGHGVEPIAARLAEAEGLMMAEHRARQLTPELLAEADLVLVMSEGQRRAVAVGLLLAGPLLLPQGHWLAIGLLALVGVVRWQAGRAEGPGQRQEAPLLLMLLTLAAALVVSGLWHGGLSRVWPIVLMALFCALALLGLQALRPRITWLWGGLVLAGVGSGATGAWLRWEEGHGRVRGLWEVNAILYGNIALLAGLLCLAGLFWAWRRPRRALWLAFLSAGALGGLLASAVSGSRGGWLALPLVAGVFAAAVPRRAWRLHHAGIVALVVLLLAGLYAWPGTGVQRRVGLALKEVAAYRAGESTGSVGARLEMYRGAAWLIAEHPLAGVGPSGYRPAMQALVAQGRLPEGSERFWHAHHDLLDAWVRHGLLGLIAVLLAYAVPLWRFLPGLRAPDPSRRTLCLAGTLLPVCYLAFGMSYTLLAYPLGVAVYGGWLALLWGLYGKTLKVAPHRVDVQK